MIHFKNTTIPVIITAAALFLIPSCKEDSSVTPGPGTDEPELITTVTLQFTDSADQSVTYATFNDPDGEGGNAPVQFDTVKLKAGRTYAAKILLLDESKTPADTISNEVEEEKNEHQFFFTAKTVSIGFEYLDFDTNTPPLPVGLSTKWRTGAAATGKVQIVLKHQPGAKNGTAGPGESDVDLEFPCELK